MIEVFARLLASSLPSSTVQHLVRTARAARDMSQQSAPKMVTAALRDEHMQLAQQYDAFARALTIAEQAQERLVRLEGAALEVRTMYERVEALARSLQPPLAPGETPRDFAVALEAMLELGARLERQAADHRADLSGQGSGT